MDAPPKSLERWERTSEEPPRRKRHRDFRERRDGVDDRFRIRPGDNYERNRSPSATADSSSDQEREYRRRSGRSSAPYVRRDRRSSPSRLSPPPFNRSRRDDGYDYRRSSPRGGFGADDWRFRYDHMSGYDRGAVAGRPGFHDERSHGRHLDWPIGRYQGLLSYKQFVQELEDDILPAEAERRYEKYRTEYISTQKGSFFDAHKDEEWLRDKYHPTNLLTVIERRNENAKATAKVLLSELKTVDLCPSALSIKSEPGREPDSEGANATGKRRRHGRDHTKENELLLASPKAHPVSAEPRRIQTDVAQAQALVRKLDAEKGIEGNVLGNVDGDKLESQKSHGVELLDTLLTYLWRVHGLDYYAMSKTVEPKGLQHVTAENNNHNGANASSGIEWEKKLDSFWQGRLQGQDPLEIMRAKDKIDAASAEALDPFVQKIRVKKSGLKYGCGSKGCTKLFHAAEFVHKHLKLKHPELVLELTSKLREDLYFQNYMNDPNAPGGTPVLQQPAPKDRLQRRKPGPDVMGCSRDDRGSRREHSRADRDGGGERHDGAESSPTRDYPSLSKILDA